jgi:porin
VGSVLPVDFDSTEPERNAEDLTTLSEFYIAQALSEKLVLVLGKVDIIGGKDTPLLGNPERNWFFNTGMRTNPALAPFIQYTTMTAAVIWLPNPNLRLSTGILDNDPEDRASTTGFDPAFHGRRWFTVAQNIQITVKPFGLEGHQTIGYAWMNRGYRLLEESPRCEIGGPSLTTLLRPAILWNGLDLARDTGLPPFFKDYYNASTDWVPYYRFDQYLYQEAEDSRQGFGFFGRASISSGKSNPIEGFYMIGLGGTGGIPDRDNDTYGIGYYQVNLSDELPNILKVHSEQGIELFYNIEIRPGVRLTPDLQVIINPGGGLEDYDVAIVYGFRLEVSL